MTARPPPARGHEKRTAPGLHSLGLGRYRDGLLHVPHSYRTGVPTPLIVMLHGAGGDARGAIAVLADLAENNGIILLAPESREQTWDIIRASGRGGFGPDVRFIDYALEKTFSLCDIQPDHIAIAGFSDGASYALSLGVGNGGLFSHVIAFSPGFLAANETREHPRIFVSHGTHDRVLDIDHCSRRLIGDMRSRDFDLEYREFDGGHSIPDRIARAAIEWFISGAAGHA